MILTPFGWRPRSSTARALGLVALFALSTACAAQQPPTEPAGPFVAVDSAQLIDDLRFLSNPSLEGRAAGSRGNAEAREYIANAFEEAGLDPVAGERIQEFQVSSTITGVNVLGMVQGTQFPERFIVVTAHYDHLGIQSGDVFVGADDNASGSAALIALARHFTDQPPLNSILFAAVDAEELGLLGAEALVGDPPIPLDQIALNVNMDMVSRSPAGEIFAAGTHHYPFLAPLVEEVAARSDVELRAGHDRPDGATGDDWTNLSDHGPFHARGIPFLYFGVEDHPDYHRPTDTFDRIDPDFYLRAVEMIADFMQLADQRLGSLPDR